ncbi:MAG: hypothetical protein K0U47_07560 [Epsilonproteobacteria bacterium]|nr:hypothetical protein [Campylobacterota bacterium]
MSFKKQLLPLLAIFIVLSAFNAHPHMHIEKHLDHHHIEYHVCHDEMDLLMPHIDIELDLGIISTLFLLLPLLILTIGLLLLKHFRYHKALFVPFGPEPFVYHFNQTQSFLKSLLFHAPPQQ